MKNKYVFVTVLLLVLLLAGAGLTQLYVKEETKQQDSELTVVTSFYPMYIAAMNVIGDTPGVDLQNLSEPQTGCLHDYQLTPADMKLLSGADVFIVNGGGIESFLSDVAADYKNLSIVNACEGLNLLSEEDEGEEHTHEDGHNHGDVNAHAWMSIALYKQQVENILEGLCRIDPKHQDAYESNVKEYLAKLEDLEREQQSLKEELAGKHIVIFHEAYAYVAEDYDMEISYTMDLDEERQVSAGEVADVMGAIEKNDISVVLAEELYGKDMGDTVERETDAKVCYLDTLTRGAYEKDSYLDAMRHNMELLKEAFAE
ncbi:MAG: metal ABC transporter substrate-binding protein [Lachnospiraceae bacterium]|nr:metal ABC transporter substrate-binding protein [Lachnospiraceae bacterium]